MAPTKTDVLMVAMLAGEQVKFDDKRRLLRIAFDMWQDSSERIDPTAIGEIMRRSPLFSATGTPTTVKVRCTAAGLRDVLTNDAIYQLCTGFVASIQLMQALQDPSTYGVTNPKTSTGYNIGEVERSHWVPRSVHDHSKANRVAFNNFLKDEAHIAKMLARIPSAKSRDFVAGMLSAEIVRRGLATVIPIPTASKGATSMATKTALKTLPAIDALEAANIFLIRLGLAEHSYAPLEEQVASFIEWLEANTETTGAKAMVKAVLAVLMARESLPAHGTEMDGVISGLRAEAVTVLRAFLAHIEDAASGEDAEGGAPVASGLPSPLDLTIDPSAQAMLDAVLASAKMPGIGAIKDYVDTLSKFASDVDAELVDLRNMAKRAKTMAAMTPKVEGAATASGKPGELPEGKVVMRKAADLFGITGASAKAFSFEVPSFEWAFPHPDVPSVDAEYIFRPEALLTVLLSLLKSDKTWIKGHTGTGKSTLIEQVAARLNWPCLRINFDSDITRMDLVGKQDLVVDATSGKTVTKWVDGVLPHALRNGFILLLDEIDFVRPDIAYVLQSVLEDRGMTLNENGGEVIRPQPMFRLFATANTTGQGDEFGMYQGARPQSLAFLDRFTVWIDVDYLPKDREKALLCKRVPELDSGAADTIMRYVAEHRQAFTGAQVLQPISPRGITTLAERYVAFLDIYGGDRKRAFKTAFQQTMTARASSQDAVVLNGLVNKLLK